MGVYVKYVKTPKANDVDVERVRMQKHGLTPNFYVPDANAMSAAIP